MLLAQLVSADARGGFDTGDGPTLYCNATHATAWAGQAKAGTNGRATASPWEGHNQDHFHLFGGVHDCKPLAAI